MNAFEKWWETAPDWPTGEQHAARAAWQVACESVALRLEQRAKWFEDNGDEVDQCTAHELCNQVAAIRRGEEA